MEDFETLIDAARIAARVRELGEAISRDYAGETIRVVSVLLGAQIFLADLLRHLSIPVECDVLRVSSYDGGTSTSGAVRFEFDLQKPIEGRHVLLVEDIVDTGLTMRYLLDTLALRKPASLKVCTLLHKPKRTRVEVPLAYVGFAIPDRFVIGYGLDYQELYRNLPHIAALREEMS